MSENPGMNRKLKDAVQSIPVPPYLESKIRARVGERSQPRFWSSWKLAPAAAALVLSVAGVVTYQLGHLRLTASSQESYIVSVTNQIATLMRVGLGDHIHCAVYRKFPKNPPATEEFVKNMNPEYAGLVPLVRDRMPAGYQLMLAHECRYHGRPFVHLSLVGSSNLMSLVITRKGEGESFRTEGLIPALTQAGIPMYQSGVQRFQITAFESREHLVYFVSDLPQDQNGDLMAALGPDVKSFLSKIEL